MQIWGIVDTFCADVIQGSSHCLEEASLESENAAKKHRTFPVDWTAGAVEARGVAAVAVAVNVWFSRRQISLIDSLCSL